MTTNKSVEEIVKEFEEKLRSGYFHIEGTGGLKVGLTKDFLRQALASHTNTVLQEVVERVEKLQKEYANDLQENGVVSIKKLYLEEEKRADCQGSYLSLETVLSLLNDQIISNEEKK